MRKYFVILLCLALLAGCQGNGSPSTPVNPGSTGSGKPTGSTDPVLSLTETVAAIYKKHPMELSLTTVEVDLSDAFAVKSYLGLDSGERIQEAVASESMLGAQAYSLVLCRLKDGADASAVARQMYDGIDPGKWVCVNADDRMVSAYGDTVMLVMISSVYSDDATAKSLTDAFEQVCGGKLTLRIG